MILVGAEYRGVRQTFFCAKVRTDPSTWPSSWETSLRAEESQPYHMLPATRKTSAPQVQRYDDQLIQTAPQPPRTSGRWSRGLVPCRGRAAQPQTPKAHQTLSSHPRKSVTMRTGKAPRWHLGIKAQHPRQAGLTHQGLWSQPNTSDGVECKATSQVLCVGTCPRTVTLPPARRDALA